MLKKFFRAIALVLCFLIGLYVGFNLNKVQIITNVVHHEIKEIIETKEIIKIREIINEIRAVELYKTLKDSTVTVFTSRRGVGAGVVISEDGYILTCYHLTRKGRKTGVTFKDVGVKPEDFIEVKVIAVDRENDLAILKIDTDKKLKPVKFADINSLNVGDPIITIGTPKSQIKALSLGTISKINTFVHYPKLNTMKAHIVKGVILLDIGTNSGNSGGGAFTMKGKLIGISSLKGGDNHSIIVPIDKIKKFIKEVIK